MATVDLRTPTALAVDAVGAKAANLARAANAGLPVLPGFAVPVEVVRTAVEGGGFGALAPDVLDRLHRAWEVLSDDDRIALVARSSAVSEDAEGSSMAGRFRSVIEIRGWKPFLVALDDVAASAQVISLDGTGRVEHHDMAVLVQQFLPAESGGVLFGVDPVSGRGDRFALATVRGGPEVLVGGEAMGSQQVLTRRGRAVSTSGETEIAPPYRMRRRLATLARRAHVVFGSPQDIEWGVDGRRRLWLLQSRPVTTLADGSAHGPVLGPGPLAETFPDPLSPLEQDLWLSPLREAIAHALDLTGAVGARRLARSPIVVAVGGRAAVDLGLIGGVRERRPFVAKLDPRPGARRLRAAWRTGRLRRALPLLSKRLLASVDEELRSVPPLVTLDSLHLLDLLHGQRRALLALHGQEVLAGLLLRDGSLASGGGAAAALRALGTARGAGLSEERIPAVHPEVLALVPPAIRPVTIAPVGAAGAVVDPGGSGAARTGKRDQVADLREELRMRARWVQELGALAAWELGLRLTDRGTLASADAVALLHLDDLQDAVRGRPISVPTSTEPSPALPTMFRLDGAGRPVAMRPSGPVAGHGAGGGRRAGTVVHHVGDLDTATVPAGAVLVTKTLAPSLAAALPSLSGLVAETGSVLSHLAILARELKVPTVVGVIDAQVRFPAGTDVVVDGATGAVEVVK